MLHIQENLRRLRIAKNLTQEDVAEFLRITPQSVSKWERGESYPDLTFLPALANIFDKSIDELLGMDVIRAEQTRHAIHAKANGFQRADNYAAAENVYRDALRTYPNSADMLLGLSGVLALQGNSDEAIDLMEKGIALSDDEKQKATSRAALCLLFLLAGNSKKAAALAATLPHTRESREVIQPLINEKLSDAAIQKHIRTIILGE
jgi:transcriptional regulator with XRE-family HTH domain